MDQLLPIHLPRVGFVLAAALFALLPADASGQADRIAEDWRWASYDVHAGLPGPRLSSILVDEAGMVWSYSREELAWFDEYGWVKVGPESGLESLDFFRIGSRAGGGILLRASNRLFQGDADGFEEVPLPLAEGEEFLHFASISPNEILLLTSRGLALWVGGVLDRSIPTPASDSRTTTLTRLRDGRVVLVNETGAHEWLDRDWTTRVPFQLPPHSAAAQSLGSDLIIMEDSGPRQGFWTVARDGSRKFTAVPLPTPLSGFDVSSAGDVIIVSAFGRAAVYSNGRWAAVSPTPGGMQGAREVRYTQGGDLWVAGIESASLVRLATDRWRQWPEDKGIAQNLTINRILVPSATGETWLGTSNGIVLRGVDEALTAITTVLGRRLGVVTGLTEDRNGAIWVTSGSGAEGVFRYQDGDWKHFGSADGLSVPNFHSVVLDRTGTLWFLGLVNGRAQADGNTGVVSFDGEVFETWGPDRGLTANRIYDLAEGMTGDRWFATIDGLSQWSNGRWHHFTQVDGLRASKVFTVEVDADGTVWFGHQNDAPGLGRLDADGITYLGEQEGLPEVGIWDISSADDRSLWITSRAGLGRVGQGGIAYFSRADGMLASTIWPVLPLSDRVLVGAIGGGLLELSLGEMTNPPPRVRIESIDIRPEHVDIALQVLPYQGEQDPAAAASRYRIDDEPWSAWAGGRTRLELELAPGRHEVDIETRNLFGQPGVAPSIALSVPSPFLRSPLALGGIAAWIASMVLGVGAYVRRKQVHLREIANRERYFRSLIENASDVILVLGADRRIQYASPSLKTVLGHDPATIVGQPLHGLLEAGGVEALDRAMATVNDVKAVPAETPVPFLHATEALPRALALAVRSERRADGETVTVIHGRDRSEQDRTEAQLRQALKMEAVGQLTGGVAHDFNNLLTVIIGEMELASEEHGDDLALAREAASKAAQLTSRLLAFSRQQPLMPKAVDLAELVQGLATLIRRTLSETVVLEVDVSGGPHVVYVDSGQFENALINLAVNARDAMPQGGGLKVSVASVEITTTDLELDTTVVPGRYIRTTVADTGSGISPAQLEQVFDPFFTTKEVGAGSGLGLSMVYGFVKQSGGYVIIDSKEGVGTAVSLYLPAK